jgi:DNA-binding transcriptional regulator YdaS (Cro superfamily)
MKLAQYLAIHRLTQAQFADRVAVSRPAVSHWVTGHRTPHTRAMAAISNATAGAVTAEDFRRNYRRKGRYRTMRLGPADLTSPDA